MATKKRLIDANLLVSDFAHSPYYTAHMFQSIARDIGKAPTVDAVEVPDKKLLKAINLLIKQYEKSKNSDYVHSPVAHAFYYTWKQLRDGGNEDATRND